ncbi:MAG: hypothetical protein Q7R49_01730 [Candidatus Daviesbacteria bacterium]|nr:hypothetical protein [Candidatus Daviesbacteria bacterium]
MLESLRQTNIGSLNLEEPRMLDIPFIFERDITNRDKESLIKSYNARHKKIDGENYDDMSRSILAKHIKILFPESMNRLKYLDEDWRAVTYYLQDPEVRYMHENPNRNIDDMNWIDVVDAAMNMQEQLPTVGILFPERISEIDPKALAFYKENTNRQVSSFPDDYLTSKLLSLDLGLNFDAVAMKKMTWRQEKYRKSNIEYWAYVYSSLKIIYPEFESYWNVNMSEWRKLKRSLNFLRGNDWFKFASLASSMKILAAEEVNITDQGLELTMPQVHEPFNLNMPALPEVRKF